MSDDSRQPDVQVPERPKGPANIMPGGSAHTAGGKAEEDAPRYIDVVRNLGPEYYLNFHKRPCVRDSQLVGIGAGFVGGSLAAILRRPVMQACNVAVFTWVGLSCASYQYCQYRRSKEKDGMKQAQMLMQRKREKIEAQKAARRKAREEQERLEEERRREEERKRSWKYWLDKNLKFW